MSQFFLFRWFTKSGWIGKLFTKKAETESISVKDAASKTVIALDAVLQYEDEIDLIAESISDDVEASANEVEEIVKETRDKLKEIETLPDIAEAIQDYTFSPDHDTNQYIKDIVMAVAVAMSDRYISAFEAAGIVSRTIAFIKLKKSK